MELDLSSLGSVREFVRFQQRESQDLHFLVNNAGLLSETRQESLDGFEVHFAVNHLAHFLLTLFLLPNLKRSAPSRIVVVASVVHGNITKVDFTDYNLLNLDPFDGEVAYSYSKLYNIMFASELNRRLQGTGVSVNSLHPGVIETDIIKQDEKKKKTTLDYFAQKFDTPVLTIPQGAATTLFAIGSKEGATGGQYFEKSAVGTTSPLAQDSDAARKLWELSEKLTSASFASKNLK